MKYTAYLFDFDYTLAFSEPGILLCFRHVSDVFGITGISDDAIKNTIGFPLRNALTQLTQVSDPAQIDTMTAVFHAKADEVMTANTTLYPSVAPLFHKLAGQGVKIGIVSNKLSHRINEVLKKYNLLEYVDLVLGLEALPEHKPSPAGLLVALERLGLSKDEAVYIGDSIIDSQTAKNAGMDFIAVTTGTTPKEKFLQEPYAAVVSDLSQLQV